MARVIVRSIEESVKRGIKLRASRHGRSMEEEIREILRNAVREADRPPVKLGSHIASRFAGHGFDAEPAELRGTEARAAEFDQ